MILITGAAGMSGSAVVREFVRNKVPVRALVRDRSKAAALATLAGVELVEGDMRRPETLGPALEGVERTLMISSANPQMGETQCAFVDACRRAGVRHVVKFSGRESGIGFDPRKFSFTAMHEDIEDYLEASGLAWTHLRPSQFMQVYLREIPTITGRNALCLPSGDIKLSPIDIEDIAKIAFGLLVAGGHESKSYDMTGPEALSMADIASRISQVVGRTIQYVNVSPEERRAALLAAGLPAQLVDDLDDQTAERRRHPESHVSLDAHALFGVRPTTFSEFAKRHAAEFSGERRAQPG